MVIHDCRAILICEASVVALEHEWLEVDVNIDVDRNTYEGILVHETSKYFFL